MEIAKGVENEAWYFLIDLISGVLDPGDYDLRNLVLVSSEAPAKMTPSKP